MQRKFILAALVSWMLHTSSTSTAQAAPCVVVTLTGTMSGPALANGVAGAGTLVRYGDDANDCSAVKLQFDAGRGTALRLSQADVDIGQLDAIFFLITHNPQPASATDTASALSGQPPSRVAAS